MKMQSSANPYHLKHASLPPQLRKKLVDVLGRRQSEAEKSKGRPFKQRVYPSDRRGERFLGACTSVEALGTRGADCGERPRRGKVMAALIFPNCRFLRELYLGQKICVCCRTQAKDVRGIADTIILQSLPVGQWRLPADPSPFPNPHHLQISFGPELFLGVLRFLECFVPLLFVFILHTGELKFAKKLLD